MIRGRAYRITAGKRWQRRRYKKWSTFTIFTSWIDNPRTYGMFRKTHFGCGCWMCKPWKYKNPLMETRYKFNTYRKAQFYEDYESYGSDG